MKGIIMQAALLDSSRGISRNVRSPQPQHSRWCFHCRDRLRDRSVGGYSGHEFGLRHSRRREGPTQIWLIPGVSPVGSSGNVLRWPTTVLARRLFTSHGVPQSLVVTISPSATNTEGANPTGSSQFPVRVLLFFERRSFRPSIFIFVSEDGASPVSPTSLPIRPSSRSMMGRGGASLTRAPRLGESSSGLRLFVTNFQRKPKSDIYDENIC